MGYWVVDAACWSRMALIKGTKMKLDQSEMFFSYHFDRVFAQRKSEKVGTQNTNFYTSENTNKL